MDDDLRKRHAEALARWAQMYPIPAWGLARDGAAENLAQRWGEVAATFTLAVRDEEMAALRERAEKAEAILATPDAAVYNLVWTAARNEVTRSWLASQGLVVMEQAAYDAGLADLRRERGEADLRAEQAEATVARIRKLHHGPRTQRYGSGCVQCGLVWPCPTFRLLDQEEA